MNVVGAAQHVHVISFVLTHVSRNVRPLFTHVCVRLDVWSWNCQSCPAKKQGHTECVRALADHAAAEIAA